MVTDAVPTDDQLKAFEERMRVRRAAEIAEEEAEADRILREAEELRRNILDPASDGPNFG